MRIIVLTLVLLLQIITSPIAAQNFYKGLADYHAGDFATALKELMPFAEDGDSFSQLILGLMYKNGEGVLQDNVIAHMWYNIGAANGNEIGGKNRDTIAMNMSSEDISKAQAMATECMKSNYQKCGY